MDTLQEITGLALCSGGNGLELGLRIALPNYRTIAISEGEAYCLAATSARIQEGSMDECFVAPDLRKLDARGLRGRIDILSAGFPCQPHSVAGKRAGTEDERWLWPDIDRIIDECRPDIVFLENVAGLLRDAGSDVDTNEDLGIEPDDSIGGMGTVLRDLAERGYDAQWIRLRASRVGASHQRARVFILAYRANNQRWRRIRRTQAATWKEGIGRRGSAGGGGGGVGTYLANPEREPWSAKQQHHAGGRPEGATADGSMPGDAGIELANPTGARFANTEDPGTDRNWAGEGERSSEPERNSSELGNPTQGRRRKRGEPSRGIGQPDGPNEDLDHADSSRSARTARETRTGRQHVKQSGGDVAKPTIEGLPKREDQSRDSGEAPGNAATSGTGGELEDSARDERNGSHGEGGLRRGVSQTSNGVGITDAIGGIFAPGPSDARWNEVLVLNPWLRPSVSQAEVESPVCNLANGLADLVGVNRTDALRMLGNGVVPLQAAAAFTELLRRIEL